MKYRIDFKRFIGGLLPMSLRGNVVDWAVGLCTPFKALHHRLMEYRRDKLWNLQYNAQTVSMEALLNDYFGDVLSIRASNRRIVIEDGEILRGVYVYGEAEHLPLLVGCINITSHSTWGAAPFVVKIPAELQGDTDIYNKVDRLVSIYKLYGTKHQIIYY